MKKLRTISCLLLICLAYTFATSGCHLMNVNSPERQRKRMYAIKTDLDHMVDDADWILGLHRPSLLHNEGMR